VTATSHDDDDFVDSSHSDGEGWEVGAWQWRLGSGSDKMNYVQNEECVKENEWTKQMGYEKHSLPVKVQRV